MKKENKENVAFLFLNYATIYSMEGTDPLELRSRACFSAISWKDYNKKEKNTYHIHIYKDFSKLTKGYDNYCPLEMEQVIKYLKGINYMSPFKYDIEDLDDHFIINCIINGTISKHMFILTAIRYLYEREYAILLYDAMTLKETPGFKNINILNLLALVSNTSPGNYSRGHTLIYYAEVKKFVNPKIVKERTSKGVRVVEVFNKRVLDTKDWKNYRIDNEDSNYSIWTSEEQVKYRMGFYIENYKNYKKELKA